MPSSVSMPTSSAINAGKHSKRDDFTAKIHPRFRSTAGNLFAVAFVVPILCGCEMQQRPDGSVAISAPSLGQILDGKASASSGISNQTAIQYPTSAVNINVLIARVSTRFKHDFTTGGISGVARDVQHCYRSSGLETLRDCIALDGAAKYLDDGHLKLMQSRGAMMRSFPYFADQAWSARVQQEGRRTFGSDNETMEFLDQVERPIVGNAMR